MRKSGFIMAVVAGAAFAGACSKSDPSTLISPTAAVGALNATFAQDPIPFNGRATCPASAPNSWIVRPTIAESNGVAVTLKSWSYTVKNRTGVIVNSDDASSDIARFFGSTTIPGRGSVSTAILDCEPASFTGGSGEFTFFGADANGLPVSTTISATLAQ